MDLSMSYPSGGLSRALKDVTKSQLGCDPLSESWPLSGMHSSLMARDRSSLTNNTEKMLKSQPNSCSPDSSSLVNDLLPLSWLQKDYILDIPPLDDDGEDRPINYSLTPASVINRSQHQAVYADQNDDRVTFISQEKFHKALPGLQNTNIPPPNSHKTPSGMPDMSNISFPESPSGNHRAPKPAYSYTHLIFLAIESSVYKAKTVNQIYSWCETHFSYFKTAGPGWKNSLRHNLSINKCFKRMPRDGSGPGRGAYWTVEPSERPQLLEAVKRNPWTYRAGMASIPGLLSSLPSSTTSKMHLNNQSSVPLNLSPSAGSAAVCPLSSDDIFSSATPDSSSPGSSMAGDVGEIEEEEAARYASMLRHLHMAAAAREKREGSSEGKACRHQLEEVVEEGEIEISSHSTKSSDSTQLPHVTTQFNASDFQGVLDLITFQTNLANIKALPDVSSTKISPSSSGASCERCTARKRRRLERRLVRLSRDGLALSSAKKDSPLRPCNAKGSRCSGENTRTASPAVPTTTSTTAGKEVDQGSQPRRRGMSTLFITPAPNLDHEYAKFQAQLHPATNFSDEEDELEDEDHREVERIRVDADSLQVKVEADQDSESTVSEVEPSPPKSRRKRKRVQRSPSPSPPPKSSKRKRYVPKKTFKPIGWTKGTSWDNRRLGNRNKTSIVTK